MKKADYLNKILGYLENPKKEVLEKSMRDVHHKGMFSLVINGEENGRLTRVFIATEELPAFNVQFHTHRYPIKLTSLKGKIRHHVAEEAGIDSSFSVSMSKFKYLSSLNGGNGLEYHSEQDMFIEEHLLPNGASIEMSVNDIHTVSADKGAMWIVEEQGFQVQHSWVYGIPFVLDGLYKPALPFQINDMVQKVRREVKNMILNYKLV